MKSLDIPAWEGRFTARDLRAVAARWSHPEDPLAEWNFEFGEWRRACVELQQLEPEKIGAEIAPAPLTLRRQRHFLFLLMTHGEYLALQLLQSAGIAEADRGRLIDQVDAFLGALRDCRHTWWQGEPLPAHREVLALLN